MCFQNTPGFAFGNLLYDLIFHGIGTCDTKYTIPCETEAIG